MKKLSLFSCIAVAIYLMTSSTFATTKTVTFNIINNTHKRINFLPDTYSPTGNCSPMHNMAFTCHTNSYDHIYSGGIFVIYNNILRSTIGPTLLVMNPANEEGNFIVQNKVNVGIKATLSTHVWDNNEQVVNITLSAASNGN